MNKTVIIIGIVCLVVTVPLMVYSIELQTQIVQRNDQILELHRELTHADNQILELQKQVNDLSNQTDALNQNYLVLNQTYIELLRQYEKLLNDYKTLNAPISNFTSIGDLDLTIATHQRTYSYKDPVSGNVTIYYHNGTAFKSRFVIYFEQLDGPMASGATFDVNGYGEFYLKPPAFIYGPGTYRIGILALYDSEGYMITIKRDEYVYVTVEAK